MSKVFESLRPFIRAVANRAGWVVAIAVILSLVGIYNASKLSIDTDFSKLIPSSSPSVQAIERLREEVGGESPVDVVIESPSFEANKRFAEALIPLALEMSRDGRTERYLNRVDYIRDTEFLEDNALYFATLTELDSLETYLYREIENARLEANPFFFDIEDDFDDVDEGGDSSETLADLEESYSAIVGKEYPISDDSTTMVVRFYPTGSQTNISFISDLYEDLEALTASMGPASFHPEMEITLAGRLLRQLIEVRSITDDVIGSFGAGVMTVLLIVVAYFTYKAYVAHAGRRYNRRVLLSSLARAPVMGLLIGIPLLMSLTWTFGIAYATFGALNLMTSTLGLVLFGLGIDYGIHFYARYSEERGRGLELMEAIETTFTSTGQAITVGAMTTAGSLFVLCIAQFKGFSEFGLIAGLGIINALFAMITVLPALLVLFERARLLNFDRPRDTSVTQLARGGRFPLARGVIFASVAMVVAAIVLSPRVGFEYDFGSLEPDYEAYDVLNEKVRLVYGGGGSRRNPAYLLVDTPEEARQVRDAVLRHAAQDTLTPTIGYVETIQDRFPMTPGDQEVKLQRVAEIRDLLNEPFLQGDTSGDIDRLRRAASTTGPLAIDEVPESLRNQFLTKSGEIGHFVMVYPSVGLSDGRNSMAFSEDVGTIVTETGDVYHAGSTSLVAADMLRLMMAEAPWMIIATLVIVGLLMWVHFGSVRWTMLALVPLLVGVLWMLLFMEIFNIKLTFYNMVVLPAVLGIGNDAGVHIVHRFREEGKGSIMDVLRSSGEHMSIASLTTMVGFGGLVLSFHPGLFSIGLLAFVGIGATWIAAITFLPALLQYFDDRADKLEGGSGSNETAPLQDGSEEPGIHEPEALAAH